MVLPSPPQLISYKFPYILAVRGMMYYRRALELQAFLDMASDDGKLWVTRGMSLFYYMGVMHPCWCRCYLGILAQLIFHLTPSLPSLNHYNFCPNTFSFHGCASELVDGYKVVASAPAEAKKSQRSMWAQLQAIADMKFTYVATCQIYGAQKRAADVRATDILNLMLK